MISKDIDMTTSIERRKRKRELQHYWVSFVMMLLFTLLSFLTVSMKDINPTFKAFFIIILALMQVIYQLYYFMHLKDKEHGFPSLFIYGGLFIAIVTIFTFMTIVWVG